MFSKLNHLAITSDHYTLLGMFYRAMFGLKASGDTAREIGAISVGDGYLGMTLIPRRGGRRGHGRSGGNRLGDRWRRRRGWFSRRTLLRHARHGRSGRAFERRQPDLDPAQLPAEPDGFHQRGDGHDREGQQQQHEHDKE